MDTEPRKILDVDVETGTAVERELTEADLEGWPILQEGTPTE